MRIGELAGRAGLGAKTVRFYEQAGLLPEPPRTASGYRDYPAEAVERLAFIRDAQTAGLTLAEIRSILAIRDDGDAPCAHVTALINEHLTRVEQRITELHQARAALRQLQDRAIATDPRECRAEHICTILSSPPSATTPSRDAAC